MRDARAEVCVVIAALNAQDSIGRAVKSALAQEHVREVIVVDDGSCDETAKRARLEDDGSNRLAVVSLARCGGPAAARNVALERARSSHFCVLDADDYFLPGRIARLLEHGIGAWDMLADDIIIVPDGHSGDPPALMGGDTAADPLAVGLEAFVRGNISNPSRHRRELGFLKPVISRDFLAKHGLRYDENLRLGEDYALYVRALIAGARFAIASACGYVAVERGQSISGSHATADLSRLAEFDKQLLTDEPRLTAAEQAALQAHLRATQRKHDYRRVLDQRRERGLLAGALLLVRSPSSAPYVVSEIMRAKWRGWLDRLFGRRACETARGARLLVGLPKAKVPTSSSRSET